MWNALHSAGASAENTYDSLFYPGGIESTNWPDHGTTNWEPYPVEAYAQFFAFLAMIDPNTTNRVRYAQYGRNLLMHGIHEALKGQAPHDADGNEVPYRDQFLMTYNRANYWGDCWGTAVDWLQASGALSSQDLDDIRSVFLRWCNEMLSGYNHPLPIGMANDPQLLSDSIQLRSALNNYYTGHMRNIALCALSIDANNDSPVNPALPATLLGNTLRSYITNATGAWLYQQFAVYENSNTVATTFGVPAAGMGVGEGGLSVEGFLYGHSFGYLSEALLGLKTAGYHDETLSGPQVRLMTSRFWEDFADGFLVSLTPTPSIDPTRSYLGPLYQFASYGDVLRFWITPDHADTFASLGILDEILGNTNRLNKDRWIVENVIEGGATGLVSRTANIWGNANSSRAILHFLLFDPAAAKATDPRPALPLNFHAPAIGRLLSRNDWTTNCSWFNFKCTYISINHQIGDGGQFEFFRKGEWLCKELSGYTSDNLGSCPEFHNTLGLENTSTAGSNSTPTALQWYESHFPSHGAQWKEGLCAGDPTTYASFALDYTYAFAEMTNLYNRPSFTPDSDFRDITQANRSIIWLKPDHIVVYDRATSKTANRFKRWFLQTLSPPTISGKLATSTTANGQKFFVQNLLPANATLSSSPAVLYKDQAEGEPPTHQLMIEDSSNPSDVRFLNVLQGADSGSPHDIPLFVRSANGNPFEGAQVKSYVVLFPLNVLPGNISNVTYAVSTNANQHYLCGLPPYSPYQIISSLSTSNWIVTVSPGGTNYFTDAAGVLQFSPSGAPTMFALSVVNGSASGLYPANASVSISATNVPAGQVFASWSGYSVVNSNNSTTTVYMPASNITVTANFAQGYQLNVTNGIGSGVYPAGSQVSITADPPLSGQIFDQWIGLPVANASATATTLIMPATNAGVTATYKTAPTVTLTVVNGSGSGSYLAGTSVSISAAASPGQVFDQWVGFAVGNAFSSTTTLTIPGTNVTVTATFKAAPVNYYSLSVLNGTGSGSYAAGTVVTIKAGTPPPGLLFDQWIGVPVTMPMAPTTTLIMPSANATVRASFKSAATPSWELWADRSNGLANGGSPTLAINAQHEIFYTFWNGTPTGIGRVYKNTTATPHTFSLIKTNGFTIDKTVQQNVGDLEVNANGDPIAAISSTVGSTQANVNWFYHFNPNLNNGLGGWAPSALIPNGFYFYNVRIMESDPSNGKLYAVGDSPALWMSPDGNTFTGFDQQGRLPSNLRGGGSPKTREFALSIASPSSRYPQGIIFTAGENNGLVCSFDQGTNWMSVDPDYLNPVSPLARAHALYDLTIPNQVSSGAGDTGGLGWRGDHGRVFHQTPGAFGYGGSGPNGAGGSDAVRLYSFLLNRPDLPDLVASGIASEVFAGGQGVQSQTLRTTSSGWTFVESPTFPANGQGGIYMTHDGVSWENINRGINYSMNPKISGGLGNGARSSVAVDGDDVFMATSSGSIYHFVSSGTNTITGIVRDSNNSGLPNVVVTTTFGHWALTADDGSYAITNVGNSRYPIAVTAKVPGVAFAVQQVVMPSIGSIDFSATVPVLTSISVSPQSNTIVAGGLLSLTATANDQFGVPLSPQPVFSWSTTGGSINSNGLFLSPFQMAGTNVISASCSNVTGTAVVIAVTNALPFISGLSTNSGSVLGGAVVTISGGNFPSNSVVLFGGVVASTISITNNAITCYAPNVSRSPTYGVGGPVPVTITTPSGAGATLQNGFTYQPDPFQTFFVTIIAGTTGGQTQTSAHSGTTLNLAAATPPPGQIFYAWTGGGTGSFGNITSSNTTFIMPAHDVSLVATYKKLPTLSPASAPTILTNYINAAATLVTLSSTTTNADIYYTLDGPDPTTATITPVPTATLYTGPFLITDSRSIKAIASAANRPDSAITTLNVVVPPIEIWRANHFGTNVVAGGNLADPDGDGIVNVLEYAFGLDPNLALKTNIPIPGISIVSNINYITLRFTRDLRATDIEDVVEVSGDLTNWVQGSFYSATNVIPTTPVTIEVSRTGNPVETIVVRDAMPMTNTSRFMRVKSTLVP